jgi:hypothetical protein|tara:strand:- start:397 stop:609 length:213 start_codon:yes stop_codon:yes gene_type:complete
MSLTDSTRKKTYLNQYNKNQKVAGSTSSNLIRYRKWKKLYESGGNMRKNLPKTITQEDIKLFLKLYKKGH